MKTCQYCEKDAEMIWLEGSEICPLCGWRQEPLPMGIYVLGAVILLVVVFICSAVWGDGLWVFAR